MGEADNDNEDCDCCFCRGDLPDDLIEEVLNAKPVGKAMTLDEALVWLDTL